MKKLLVLMLVAVMVVSGCSKKSEEVKKTGKADGFNGLIEVEVTLEGDKITNLTAKGDGETPNIGGAALESLTKAIVEKGSVEVDAVSGATVTSEGLFNAINNALDPEKYPYMEKEEVSKPVDEVNVGNLEIGTAVFNTGRLGPGKDDTGTQVYSVNQVFANVLFDADGKIVDLIIDQLEVATPNYDGEGMPHFTGFPTQSYNNDENHDEKVDGTLTSDDTLFNEEIAGWKTKRERGDGYVMNTGKWYEQMDKFESLFIGMTVSEVEEWFTKYCSDLNGRPLKAGSDKPEDAAKYDALTQEEKDMLADVTTAATMSLNDGHGNLIEAIKKAYEVRVPVNKGKAAKFGFGLNNTGRLGPGKDDTGTQVYSVNQVFASALFDADGKIITLNLDQLEVATPNYDGEGMPHFTGFPGASYNNDENHDEKVDGTLTSDDTLFNEEIAGWKTKRERGDGYVMNTGKWYEQMDKFESLFTGMTVSEVEEWFTKYCSDLNGRPLKAGSDKPEDAAKYDALTQEEKDMLADVTTAATMSLNDGHGNILAAIKDAYDSATEVDITIE